MAHLIETIAYAGTTPWHGLGNQLTQKQPIEVWQREAGMDWQIQESPVHFKSDAIAHLGAIHSFPEQKVLFRSDTKAPLSVVSNRDHTVQPREVIEFYRDLTEVSGYELETAGVLKGGRKFWALARTGQGTALKDNDQVNGYLLLATSCDGTLATTATPTTVRVVCNNTLTIALDGTSREIKVPHNTRFNPKAVKTQLGIAVSQWDDFMYRMRALAERKVQWHEALGFFMNVYIEREIRELKPDARRRIRQEKAAPLMDALHAWMIAQRQLVHDGLVIAKALDYSLKRWTALSRYLNDGTVPIDNNHIEQQNRPWALGSKNWLFAGSLRSGKRAAALMSLIQSAKLNGHDPYEYLKDVLERLPTQKMSAIGELLPHKWQSA
ncbi:hypothetical protein DOZ80_04870 [Pseudomonas fluorescens]|uniref:Transposase IS66 C-terminal domain-containing protein n=1 Tax=Pseudomonas fluorescens TaxID=294 RepID=A0A327N8X7_PSEFL|nr:DUF932 domain-containing protein [Pseudomonas fluorescens]RAI71183.1 hypothetical protein DOZ80_04870 [Pseudomonas fluorescens]